MRFGNKSKPWCIYLSCDICKHKRAHIRNREDLESLNIMGVINDEWSPYLYPHVSCQNLITFI